MSISPCIIGSILNFSRDFRTCIPTVGLRPNWRWSRTRIFNGGMYNSSFGNIWKVIQLDQQTAMITKHWIPTQYCTNIATREYDNTVKNTSWNFTLNAPILNIFICVLYQVNTYHIKEVGRIGKVWIPLGTLDHVRLYCVTRHFKLYTGRGDRWQLELLHVTYAPT